jgi:outer membrane protein OmpA-like peptidoglycan-associated protein
MERYSVAPFLTDSFLLLEQTVPPDAIRLDLSLAFKYMHQPWRIYNEPSPTQVPVQEHIQIRPAVAFGYKRWFDVAVVVPFSYQVAGNADQWPSLSGHDGTHLLDPELFIRVPILHERRAGFGLAGGIQQFFPLGTADPFVNYHDWQTALMVAADWTWQHLAIGINTGFLLRPKHASLTPLGSEWFVCPGISYSFPLGGYSLGLAVEGNIATELSSFFSDRNGNAYQLLCSLILQPSEGAEGVYAALGGGSRMQGGGYGVPLSNVDARVGYSLHFRGKRAGQEAESASAAGTAAPATGTAAVSATGTADTGAASTPGQTGTQPGSGTAKPPDQGKPVKVARQTEPMAAQGRVPVVHLGFATGAPGGKGAGAKSGSAEMPAEIRQQVTEQRDQILRELQVPGARLVIVGFADKCYEGPPPLAKQYNQELSERRASAMLQVFREVLGRDLEGLEVQTLAMGMSCANPHCPCGHPEDPGCANDRKVDVYIQMGNEEYRCPNGTYWLAQ